MAFNVIPCTSQGPNKTQMAYSNLGNSGKFFCLQSRGCGGGNHKASQLVNHTLLESNSSRSNSKSVRSLVLPRVLSDQMLPFSTNTCFQSYSSLSSRRISSYTFLGGKASLFLTNQHFLSLHSELRRIVIDAQHILEFLENREHI